MGNIAFSVLFLFLTSCSSYMVKTLDSGDILDESIKINSSLKEINSKFFISNFSCMIDWENSYKKIKKNIENLSSSGKRDEGWFDLANCLSVNGKFKEALFYYNLYLLSPDANKIKKSIVYQNIGIIYQIKSLDVLALSFYDSSLNLNPKNSKALFLKGMTLLNSGNYLNSLNNFKKLRKIMPKDQLVSFVLGVNYYLLGRIKEIPSLIFYVSGDYKYLLDMALLFENRKITKKEKEDFYSKDFKMFLASDFFNLIKEKNGLL